jgi:pimeloyl-ACP methyl ester carboxylesterase
MNKESAGMRVVIITAALVLAGCSSVTGGDRGPFPGLGREEKPKPVNIRPGPGTYTTPDGTAIAYEVKGTGDPTLVFVHCWACDRSYWRYQVEEFSKSQRVVVMDLAGHGASGKTRANWTIEGLGEDVAGLVTSLGLPDVVLVGHSMGGPVSLVAAAKLPGKVRGVVCADTLHNAETPFPREVVEQLAAGYEKDFPGTMAQMVPAMFPPGVDTPVMQEVITKSSATPREPAIGLIRDFPNFDTKAAFQNAGVPIRCINAAARPPMAPATAVETNRKYADFDAVLMEDIGHYVQLERPQEFNENLRFVMKDFPAPKK